MSKQAAVAWAQRLWSDRNKAVILDTETTGLDKKAEVIEISIIDLKGKVLLNQRIRPVLKEEFRQATEVHGISYDDLKKCPTMRKVSKKIIKIMTGKIVLAYNVKYDRQVLQQSFAADGVGSNDLNGQNFQDVMEPYTEYLERSRWAKLPGGDHSALGDCRATLTIIREMAGVSVKKKSWLFWLLMLLLFPFSLLYLLVPLYRFVFRK